MIPKKLRLPKAEFHSGAYKTVRTPWFSLKAKKSLSKIERIGVVIGKSVHKNATERNFWKRQAKAALAGGTKGVNNDFLVVFSPKVNELTKKQFKNELLKALRTVK
jgi:ribonuclease P protein component